MRPPRRERQLLVRANPRLVPNYGTTDRRPAPQTAGTHEVAEGRLPLVQKGTRPGQRSNRGGIGNGRRWAPLIWTPRFHPTPSHSPLPGTRHPGIRPHHLWSPRSSTDYRADVKEVPLDIIQKRRPRLRAFLWGPKAQEIHQSARRHPQALGSSRNKHPRHGNEV